MGKDTHSLNAQVVLDNYNTFKAIIKNDKKSSINSYMDKVIEEFNDRWMQENPDKLNDLNEWITDAKK